jgi:SAM-dependent methyltransferase
MGIYATEITSDQEPSDSPLHQRLLKPYHIISDWISGDVLEVGCGEGRGIGLFIDKVQTFAAIDKIEAALDVLRRKYPMGKFTAMNIPPFHGLESNAYDFVISFQVIEHIQDDAGYLKEIHRVLKPGGKAFLTTPNRPFSLTRNPWHVREYTGDELGQLAGKYFKEVEVKGIGGNEKVKFYYEENKRSVEKITRWDIFDLQHRLPAALLRLPYEIMNRMNRKMIRKKNTGLVSEITHEDYLLVSDHQSALDLFMILKK